MGKIAVNPETATGVGARTGLCSLGQCMGRLRSRWEASALSWKQMGEKVQGQLLWRLRGSSEAVVSQGDVWVLKWPPRPECVLGVKVLIRGQNPGRIGVPLQLPPFSLLVLLAGPRSVLPAAWRLPRL